MRSEDGSLRTQHCPVRVGGTEERPFCGALFGAVLESWGNFYLCCNGHVPGSFSSRAFDVFGFFLNLHRPESVPGNEGCKRKESPLVITDDSQGGRRQLLSPVSVSGASSPNASSSSWGPVSTDTVGAPSKQEQTLLFKSASSRPELGWGFFFYFILNVTVLLIGRIFPSG